MKDKTDTIQEEEVARDPKYIKWPGKKKVFFSTCTLIAGCAALLVLIAAGDAAGNYLISLLFH